MPPPDLSSLLGAAPAIASTHEGLELLVLHGSRARGDEHAASDWDFAYLSTPPFDPSLLQADLALALRTDRVDLADLKRAGGLLRYRVARDGVPVFEAPLGSFDRFWFQAVSFWCDAEPVLRAGIEAVLDELGPCLDREILAERAAAVERHLMRVAQKLPRSASELSPNTDASDAVILHVWQATQIVLDIALSACAQLKLGTPNGYADAFVRLQNAAGLEATLTRRLVAAAGFRNVVAHAYESIDMERVHQAATNGPSDLRAFLAAIRDRLPAQ